MREIDTRKLVVAELLAYWNWFTDEGLTPELVFKPGPGTSIPPYLKDQKLLVLKISDQSTSGLHFGELGIAFDTAFGGVRRKVFIPYEDVVGMKATELPDTVGMFSVIDFQYLSKTLETAGITVRSGTVTTEVSPQEKETTNTADTTADTIGVVRVDFIRRRKE